MQHLSYKYNNNNFLSGRLGENLKESVVEIKSRNGKKREGSRELVIGFSCPGMCMEFLKDTVKEHEVQ